jgi:cell division septal protein FtsQ
MRKKRNRYNTEKGRVRRTIFGWFKTLVGLFLIVSSIVGLSGALAHAYHALLSAPWLGVKEIRISGLHHLERKEILNALGVPKGANILSLKVAGLPDRLEKLPWISSSVVRLDPPGKIHVEIVERKPLALVHANDYFLLDTEGRLFVKVGLEDMPTDVLSVELQGMNFKPGDSMPSRQFDELKGITSAFDKVKQWLPLTAISQCSWDPDRGLIFQTMGGQLTIQLGSENFDLKLDRLRHILAVLQERQWSGFATRIDLDYPNRAYVEGSFPGFKGT